MERRIKIAFVHDWEPDFFQEMTWKDGLARAVQILSQKHDLMFFTCGKKKEIWPHPFYDIHVEVTGDGMKQAVSEFNPDVILHWADCTRPNAKTLKELGKPMALCFAGGSPMNINTPLFDHIFVESESYKERFAVAGYSVSTAFGTNTELFHPLPDQQKTLDTLFPATFCTWKRHRLFLEACRGLKSCAVGFMYPVKEAFCWQECEKAGVLVLPHVSAEALSRLYAASKVVVVPSRTDGGSQRTVLEAMAMNIPVVCCSDSDKTSEYINDAKIGASVAPEAATIRKAIEELTDKPVDSRKYILEKWSEYIYADNLEKELLKLCQQNQD